MTTEFWKFQKSCFNLISTWYKGAQGTKRFFNINFSFVFLSQNKKLTIPRKCNSVLLTSFFCYVFATNPCDWTTFKGPAHVKPFSTCKHTYSKLVMWTLSTHTQYQGMQVLAFLTFLNFPPPPPRPTSMKMIPMASNWQLCGRKPHPLKANQLESTVKVSNRRTLY